MNHRDLATIVKLAEQRDYDPSAYDDSSLVGLTFATAPVYATVPACVRFLRWQAMQLNGFWDIHELDEMCELFRKKVKLV